MLISHDVRLKWQLILQQVNRVRLVSDEGLIPTDAFYNYLSVWVSNDPMGYAASQAQMKPKPPSYEHNRADANLIIPRASAITYSQMPYYLNGMYAPPHSTCLIYLPYFQIFCHFLKQFVALIRHHLSTSNCSCEVAPRLS